MTFKPTGYKPGRPRKGEIRPETKRAAYDKAYHEKNVDKIRECNRLGNEKFRQEKSERWSKIQQGVRLRKKLWNGTILSVGVNRVVIHPTSEIEINVALT